MSSPRFLGFRVSALLLWASAAWAQSKGLEESSARQGSASGRLRGCQPIEVVAGTRIPVGDLQAEEEAVPTRPGASVGCSMAPASLPRPSLAVTLAALGAGIGLGLLGERARTRRAVRLPASRRGSKTHRGGAFEHLH